MRQKVPKSTSRILLLVVPWIIFSMYYYASTYRNFARIKKDYEFYYNHTEDDSFLINTHGCRIPNYMKTMKIQEVEPSKKTCGHRAIFVEKLNDETIHFRIDENTLRFYRGSTQNVTYSCCYKFAGPLRTKGTTDYRKLRYSSCVDFRNGTTSPLTEEVVTVKCSQKIGEKSFVFYEDAYILLKKIKLSPINAEYKNRWNVLLIGMDTMSRARAYGSMPKTVQYLKEHGWLDFRGYQKVGYNTFPNVAAFLSGKNLSAVEKSCEPGIDNCNKLFIWSDFQKYGYKTAYGEDYIQLPDTFSRFKGYKNKPTDHYVRPLFLTGETNVGNYECTKKLSSSKHVLNYALDLTNSYKNETFYGLFWLNSYSHNLNNNPTLLDNDMVEFFESLEKNDVLENTFVFFLSDHGSRTGKMRVPFESYYDERLPMLFMWVPKEFKEYHEAEYEFLQNNQYRLTTPYDLYLTMWDMCRMTNNSAPIKTSEACPQCKSFMSEITPDRTCSDVGVSEKWCTCHKMSEASVKDEKVKLAINMVVQFLKEKSQSVKTVKCTKCEEFKLKSIHRVHVYSDNSLIYYVIALVVTGDVGFEATVEENNNTLTILQPTYTISEYNVKGMCAVGRYDKAYCSCVKVPNCK